LQPHPGGRGACRGTPSAGWPTARGASTPGARSTTHERPHEALGLATPASRYRPSPPPPSGGPAGGRVPRHRRGAQGAGGRLVQLPRPRLPGGSKRCEGQPIGLRAAGADGGAGACGSVSIAGLPWTWAAGSSSAGRRRAARGERSGPAAEPGIFSPATGPQRRPGSGGGRKNAIVTVVSPMSPNTCHPLSPVYTLSHSGERGRKTRARQDFRSPSFFLPLSPEWERGPGGEG